MKKFRETKKTEQGHFEEKNQLELVMNEIKCMYRNKFIKHMTV